MIKMIIGIVTGGIIIIIIIAVTVACITKKKNDRSKSNKDAFLWDNNPTIQKEVIINHLIFMVSAITVTDDLISARSR